MFGDWAPEYGPEPCNERELMDWLEVIDDCIDVKPLLVEHLQRLWKLASVQDYSDASYMMAGYMPPRLARDQSKENP